MSLDKKGNVIIRAEHFPLAIERIFKKQNKKSIVRTMTSFKFLRDSQIVAPVYDDCTDEFLANIQVEGFAASLSGDAALYMQAGYWDILQAPEMHFEMYRIKKVIGISLEVDSNWRGGKETIMWLHTPSYWYALQDPDDSYRDVWTVVLSSWRHSVFMDGAFRRLDTRSSPPLWWPKNRKRMWTALVKHVDICSKKGTQESESEEEAILNSKKDKAKALKNGALRVRGGRTTVATEKGETPLSARWKSGRVAGLQIGLDWKRKAKGLEDKGGADDEVGSNNVDDNEDEQRRVQQYEDRQTGVTSATGTPSKAHRQRKSRVHHEADGLPLGPALQDAGDLYTSAQPTHHGSDESLSDGSLQDTYMSSPLRLGILPPFTQRFPKSPSQDEPAGAQSLSMSSSPMREQSTGKEAAVSDFSMLHWPISLKSSSAQMTSGRKDPLTMLHVPESVTRDASPPNQVEDIGAHMGPGMGATLYNGLCSVRETESLLVRTAAVVPAPHSRDYTLPSDTRSAPQIPNNRSEERRRRLGDTYSLDMRGPRRMNPNSR